MGSTLKRRSVAGVLCALLVICGAVAIFSIATWAGRGQEGSEPDLAFRAGEIEFAKRRHGLTGHPRPEGLSPLGSIRPVWDVPSGDKERMIETALGWVDPGSIAELRAKAPGLAGSPGRKLHEKGQRGEIGASLNAIQISAAALQGRTIDSVHSVLRDMGVRIHEAMPHRGLLVEVPKDAVGALAGADFLEAAMPYEAALRIDPMLGRTPMIERARAASRDLTIIVAALRGTDPERALGDLEQVAGIGKVKGFSSDGESFETTVHHSKVAQIARRPWVRYISERPEYMLQNVETPTVAMVGNVKENLPFQKPYQDVGVDGGGLNASGLPFGRRVNDDTAVVPPQIVAVTDNGLSYDSIQFSQTATEVVTTAAPLGPAHRKVHFVQAVVESGFTCDGTLSGGTTHGNVVAGTIAGNGTQLGARVSKHVYNIRPRVDNLEMDGVARSARILMQDAGGVTVCTNAELFERGGNVSPGSLTDRLNAAICPKTATASGLCSTSQQGAGGGEEVHLHVLPFGVPNFDNVLVNPTSDGLYTADARNIDAFLMNNRDYMVFAPVGNQGMFRVQYFFSSFGSELRAVYPDLFNGTAADNDPNIPSALQVSPPATAKNLVSVGSHFQDVQTAFGINQEENPANFSSKGPATADSKRTAPIILGVGGDSTGFFFSPNTVSAAVWKSKDNDNLDPVDAVLDDINFGSSFAAAEIAGVAALIRDYFAQGFYPTGARVATDRIPNVSGPLVKAAIVASANFLDQVGTNFAQIGDREMASARGLDRGGVIGIMGNSEQGYGRPVLTSVLPLANWPTGKGIGAPDTIEYPSPGLLIFDELGTSEPAINNTTRTFIDHLFTVGGDSSRMISVVVGSPPAPVQARAVDRGQMRVALAWSDPPSGPGTAGSLINDLDLDLEWAGPDDNIATPADNITYDGNSYQPGGIKLGQWGKARLSGQPDIGDFRNPVEAVHLSADPNGDGDPGDSQLLAGTWRVRVKLGSGSISLLTEAAEDDNHNGRLDPGEDGAASGGDGDGRLDADGQPYGLVVAGPVFGTAGGFPNSVVRLDKSLYGCADQVRLSVFDPGKTASTVSAAVTFEVVTRLGTVVDSEVGFVFSAGAGLDSYVSPSIPLREGKPAVRSNAILETNGIASEEPYFVRARYADTPREAMASSKISCAPNLLAWRFQIENENFTQQTLIAGGCDGDQFMDAGENVIYSVTFVNGNADHDLTDVQATLLVSGLCSNAVATACTTAAQCPAGGTCSATAVRVLNSPQNLGRIPGGQFTSASFALRIDGAALPAATAARIVDMTLRLEANNPDIQLSRQEFKFRHALNSDYETFHYSTDYPSGGREIRDFNRNLQIDKPDVTDPFIGIGLPDEDVTFSTLFLDIDPGAAVRITNMLGEDIDGDLVRDQNETDLVPNGALDGGILRSCIGGSEPGTACAVSTDCADGGTCGSLVPWNFDTLGGGGYQAFRYAFSQPGSAAGRQPWEHVRTGVCGFQSAIPDGTSTAGFDNLGAGIWHTGDGLTSTPGSTCEDHLKAEDLGTPAGTEFIEDFLISPIVAKVHQTLDDRGLPYTAEFQRLGFNLMIQTADENAGLNFNLDNNADDDSGNCLMCQEFDFNYGGIDYQVGTFKNTGYGIDPDDNGLTQRTFGSLDDPDGSLTPGGGGQNLTGDEAGFTGFTQNTNGHGITIPVTAPDFLPYPEFTAPTVTSPFPPFCTGGSPCPWTNDPQGPVRNVDFTLINYEAGFISPVEGPGGPTSAVTPFTVNPGVRWLIGLGFWNVESPGGAVADYGAGIDDVVLEWDERHPVDEGTLGHTPACQRFGQPGQAVGQQCATLSVDRTSLFECDEALTVTVNDQKRIGAGTVDVLAASGSDSRQFSTGVITAQHPVKTFPLTETAPGIFSGSVTVTQTVNSPNQLFVSTSGDTAIQFYYQDAQCDGNANGVLAQNDFNNLDGDGVAFSVDNCPFDYNAPATPGGPQQDSDADGLGNICDNCPNNANGPLAPLNQFGQPIDNQRDSDGDAVGNRCDLDDIDFDGVVNAVDNCWDVYNPLQTVAGGQAERGTACNDNNFDRDGDGSNDLNDNCVRTSNAGQADRDGDRIGDACDGDCVGAREELLSSYCLQSPSTLCTTSTTNPPCTCILRGSCSRSSAVRCATDAQCPATSFCEENPSEICTSNTPQCTCVLPLVQETCERRGIVNGVCQEALPTVTPCGSSGPGCTCISSCGLTDDDTDIDTVGDTLDNCPVIYNQPIISGTTRQADTDNDGVGDACDSAFMVDGDNNGIPDDAVSFGLMVNCGNLPLPNLVIEVVTVHDLCPPGVSCQFGDGDVFCDTGEKCEMTLKVRNAGPIDLTDVSFHLATPDSDIECVSKPSVLVGAFPVGALVDTANIGGQRRPFEYTVSQTTNTIDPAIPQKADFVLNLTSREALGTARKIDFQTLLDLDLPVGSTPMRVDPDGIPGNADDGIAFENFDNDRDGSGVVDISDGRAGIPNDITFGLNEVPGRVVGTAPSSVGDTLTGLGCAGFNIPPADPNCSIEDDNDMDWHIHCPPGAIPACPPPGIQSGTTHHITPADGQMAFSGSNSLHWGRHVNTATRLGDTTSFRALAAFMTSPINLTPLPVSGDLILSFYHIADMVDNNEAEKTGFKPGDAVDYGDVHIQVDLDSNPDPVTGNRWGTWEKLVPFENAYTHTPYIWSFWGARVTYCNLTPADTGSGPPAPRGVHETLCRPLGVWSHCGNAWGTDTTFGCPGPGIVGAQAPASGALWVQSRFSLANFLGARVRIRWIAQGFEFDPFGTVQDYVAYGRGWDTLTTDDGWWVDDIRITGAITQQISPLADDSPVPASTCPGDPDGNCQQGSGSDRGFNVSLAVSDTNNNGIFEKGEAVELNAIQTTNPGGCIDGVIEFKFLKNGATVQDFSANASFHDSPLADATYRVLARCSSDPTCTTLNGVTQSVQVYPGDGTDILLTVSHNRTAIPPLTTLTWTARPQLPPMSGYDAFQGSGTIGTPRDLDYTTVVQLACNQAALQATTTDSPAAGTAHFYMVGHSSPVAGAQTALGRHTSGAVRLSPVAVSCP